MKALKPTLAFALLAGAASLSSTVHAALVPADFSWVGDAGYKVQGTFIYDDAFALIEAEGSERGDFNNGLDYLEVTFLDPGNSVLLNVTNAQNGIVTYEWLQFQFNPATATFEDGFDMGRDLGASGDYYVFGTIGDVSSIVDVDSRDDLDSQTSTTITVSVPVPGALSLVLLGFASVLGFSRQSNKSRLRRNRT